MTGVPLERRAGRVITIIQTVVVLAERHQFVVLGEYEELGAALAVAPVHADFLVALVVVEFLQVVQTEV